MPYFRLLNTFSLVTKLKYFSTPAVAGIKKQRKPEKRLKVAPVSRCFKAELPLIFIVSASHRKFVDSGYGCGYV